MNERVRKLVAELQAITDETARFSHITSLPRSDQSELQRVMSPETRGRFLKFSEARSRQTDAQRREAERMDARRGKAANASLMVEVLLENRDRLRPQDQRWVEDIDATAAGLVGMTFTPRQEQVIREIYARYYVAAR